MCRNSLSDAAGRQCLILIEAPLSGAACGVRRGGRYMTLLSKPRAAEAPAGSPAGCLNGRYAAAFDALQDSIRPTLGTGGCTPYPAFPPASADVAIAGSLAAELAAAGAPPGGCKEDPCAKEGVACAPEAGVACVTKAAEGRVAVHNLVLKQGACSPAYIDLVSGGLRCVPQFRWQITRCARRCVGLGAGTVAPDVCVPEGPL